MDVDNIAYSLDDTPKIEVKKNKLGADAYLVEMRSGKTKYDYNWMIRIDPEKKWEWYSPCHEYVSPIKDANKEDTWKPVYSRLAGGYIESRREGSRSKDPQKYLRDAFAFEKALLNDPMNDRYLYYVAQSYHDAAKTVQKQAEEEKKKSRQGPNEERLKADQLYQQLIQKSALLVHRAEKAYLYRASVSPFNEWTDEYTYMAWVRAGEIRVGRKGYDHKALEYFGQAHEKRPTRLEGSYYILHYYLETKCFKVGWNFAKDLVNLPYPADQLVFVDQSIHQYLFAFEASLCAYYSGNKPKFVDLTQKVIENAYTPDNIRAAAKKNLADFGK